MAVIRHLGFVMCIFGPPMTSDGGIYHSAKCGWN